MPITDIGCDSGCAPNTNIRELALAPTPTSISTRRSAWSVWNGPRATSRGRQHEPTLVRKPDAGNPHVRFDERDLETARPNRHRARSRLYQLGKNGDLIAG